MGKIYKGDIGTKISLDVGQDISTAAVQKIYYTKPDGTVGSWVASKGDDNTSIYYITNASTDLNVEGVWKLTPYIEISSWKGYGEVAEIIIYPIYEGVISGELASLANLRGFLKKNIEDITDDILLLKLISKISAEIEKRSNRKFTVASYTEYQTGNGTNKTFIKNSPINSITSIYIDSDLAWTSDTQIPAASIKISDEIKGMIILADGYTFLKEIDGIENVRIIYNGGFSTIPGDLEQACIEICSARYMKAGGLVNTSMKDKINPDEMEDKAWKHIDSNYRFFTI